MPTQTPLRSFVRYGYFPIMAVGLNGLAIVAIFSGGPDNISIELLQKGEALPEQEPWASMPNSGKW